MNHDEHRFDTAPVSVGKHAVPEEQKRFGKFRERRVPRWIYRVTAILALSTVAVLCWFNRTNLAPENVLQWVQNNVVGMGVGDGFPKSFSGSVVAPKNFFVIDKKLILASDTAVEVCNSTGKDLMNRQHSYGSPVICAAGPRVLIYNLGGKSCEISTIGGKSEKRDLKQNILGGALASNGNCALISGADGYCGMLTSYNLSGQVLSYYWFSDYYPTAIALSPDGTKAAVAGVSAKEGSLSSAVYVISLDSGKTAVPAAVCSGNLLNSIFWETDGSVMAVGDAGAVFLNPANGAKIDYSFNGASLMVCCADGDRLALGLAPYEGAANQKFLLLGKDGTVKFTKQYTGKIRSISLFGQTAAVLVEGKVFFESLSGEGTPATGSAGSDASAVALRDENAAYVLGISEVRLVNRS